ncbi:hypothetical protein CMQ_2407, partial [Grosmannia clavigera kw1407]
MRESSSARIWPSQEQHRRRRDHNITHTISARYSSPSGSSRPQTPSTSHSPLADPMAAHASLPSPPPSSCSERRPRTMDMASGPPERYVPPRAPSPPSLVAASFPASASKQQPTYGEQNQQQRQMQYQNGCHLHRLAGQFHPITPDASREQTPGAPPEHWCLDCRGDGETGHRKACLKAGNASSSSSSNDSVPEGLGKWEQQQSTA